MAQSRKSLSNMRHETSASSKVLMIFLRTPSPPPTPGPKPDPEPEPGSDPDIFPPVTPPNPTATGYISRAYSTRTHADVNCSLHGNCALSHPSTDFRKRRQQDFGNITILTM